MANGVTHAAGGVRRPQRQVVAATTWLAATVSTGLCAHVGTPIDDDLTQRLDAEDAGQVLGGSSGFSGLPVSAVQEDAAAGLEDLSDLDEADVDDVIGESFRGAPRPARDACDEVEGPALGDNDQVGSAGGLGGGLGVGVSLAVRRSW